jgi:cytochrome oxidase Cu insertion factor (SCO1/SenC/PrrC family)
MTVDPTRDSAAAVKKYCAGKNLQKKILSFWKFKITFNFFADFSPMLIGFTGTVEQVQAVAKTFRVYHSEGPKDDQEDYIVSFVFKYFFIKKSFFKVKFPFSYLGRSHGHYVFDGSRRSIRRLLWTES